jgi:hypothetical protein
MAAAYILVVALFSAKITINEPEARILADRAVSAFNKIGETADALLVGLDFGSTVRTLIFVTTREGGGHTQPAAWFSRIFSRSLSVAISVAMAGTHIRG